MHVCSNFLYGIEIIKCDVIHNISAYKRRHLVISKGTFFAWRASKLTAPGEKIICKLNI